MTSEDYSALLAQVEAIAARDFHLGQALRGIVTALRSVAQAPTPPLEVEAEQFVEAVQEAAKEK